MKHRFPFKLGFLIFLCSLLLIASLPASAAEIDIAEQGLSLRLPLSLDVLTRDMARDDPVLLLYGITSAQARQQLIHEGVVLKAREITGAYTLTLSVRDAGDADFAGMDGETLAEAAEKMGAVGYEVLSSRQTNFLLFFDNSGSRAACVTRLGGEEYTLELLCQGAAASYADVLRGVALSMNFTAGQ